MTIQYPPVRPNVSGVNTGDVTLTSVGSSPNASGASLSGQALTLQPADATHPGAISAASQTLGGAKTFANDITLTTGTVVSGVSDGASAIGLKVNTPAYSTSGAKLVSWQNNGTEKAHIDKDGGAQVNSVNVGAGGGTGAALTAASGSRIVNSGSFQAQGVYYTNSSGSQLDGTGLTASSNSAGVDLFQNQSSWPIAVRSAKGASSGVVLKAGTTQASPHASAELLRVGYNLGNYAAGDGTAVLKVLGGNRVVAGAANTAPTDADLPAGSISFYLDESGNNLMVRVKYADGTTLKIATVALT